MSNRHSNTKLQQVMAFFLRDVSDSFAIWKKKGGERDWRDNFWLLCDIPPKNYSNCGLNLRVMLW